MVSPRETLGSPTAVNPVKSVYGVISKSGGGGTSVPNIPQPLQSFARSEKIGENVNVTNLLNRIGSQQAEAFNNFSNIINNSMKQRNQENEMLEQINRDDTIDIAEKVNDGINNNEIFSTSIPIPANSTFLERKEDKSNKTITELIKEPTQTEPIKNPTQQLIEIKDVNNDVSHPPPRQEPISQYENIEIDPIDDMTYIRPTGQNFVFKFKKAPQITKPTLAEAQMERAKFISNNNIKIKDKKI